MDPTLLSSIWAITADNASSNSFMIEFINAKLPDAIMESLQQIPQQAADDFCEDDEAMYQAYGVFSSLVWLHKLQLTVTESLKHCRVMDVAIGSFRIC